MKKLALPVLAFATMVQATGCIIVADDDEEGAFLVRWELLPAGTTCEQVGATTVSVLSTHTASGNGYDDLFNCEDMEHKTALLPVGSYTVSVDLLDAANRSLLGAPVVLMDQVIPDDGAVVTLPTFEFDFSRSASFKVDFAPSVNDCTDAAGLAVQEVAVLDGAQCLSLPMWFDGEATGCGTSADQPCHTCGDLAVCMGESVTQVVGGLPLVADYDLVIRGYKGSVGATPVKCWEGTWQLLVNNNDPDLGTLTPSYLGGTTCDAKPTQPR